MRTLILLTTLLLTLPAAARQPDDQLIARFEAAEADRPEAALRAAQSLTQRHPDSAVWAFNAARMHARLGQSEEAIAELNRAADLGHSGVASFEQHTDLDPLRDREDFRAILGRVRANAAKRMETFQQAAAEHAQPFHVPAGLAPGAKPPLLIALHGSGGNGKDLLDALRPICDTLGIVCVAPDAIRPASARPNSYAWTFRDESEWLVRQTIADAIDKYNADPDRIILLGFSQGANVTMVMARTHPDRFAATVPICGHYEPNLAPLTSVPPTYLLITTNDPARRTYDAALTDLKAVQPKTTLRISQGGHRLPTQRELERALEWCLNPTE